MRTSVDALEWRATSMYATEFSSPSLVWLGSWATSPPFSSFQGRNYQRPHTKRQATWHGCLPSLLGTVSKKKLYWGRLKQPKGRAKISCTSMTSPTNQPREDPFHLSSLSLHLLKFQQSARANPLSSLSGRSNVLP
jgi:hypothetical protein